MADVSKRNPDTSLKLQISLQVEGKALQTLPSCGLGRWNEKHTRKRSIVSMERVIKCIHHGNPTECGTRCWLFPVSCGYNKTKGTEIGVNVCDTARNRLKNIGFTCIKAKQKPAQTPKPKKTREAIRVGNWMKVISLINPHCLCRRRWNLCHLMKPIKMMQSHFHHL